MFSLGGRSVEESLWGGEAGGQKGEVCFLFTLPPPGWGEQELCQTLELFRRSESFISKGKEKTELLSKLCSSWNHSLLFREELITSKF